MNWFVTSLRENPELSGSKWAIQDEAGSKLPVLGYTVPYAIGNILLTAWGPVVVMLTR